MSEPGHGPLVEDLLLGGTLRLNQPARGHRAGTDAVLLAACAATRGAETIVDLGAGVGTVGLILAGRNPDASVVLVERDPDFVALARENAALNGYSARVTTVCADIAGPARVLHAAGLTERLADLVVTNPPFLSEGRARSSPLASRKAAHVMPAARAFGLESWIRAARRILKPRGRLVMIHRADALPEILAALRTGFGGVAIRPVYPKEAVPAIRVIISAVSQSKTPASLLPGLILHEADGRFTSQAEAIHRGNGLLD
jgi:tRNA1(Val) A37 N6-methylase TrmN6